MNPQQIWVMYMTAILGWKFHPGNRNLNEEEFLQQAGRIATHATNATLKYWEQQWQESQQQQ